MNSEGTNIMIKCPIDHKKLEKEFENLEDKGRNGFCPTCHEMVYFSENCARCLEYVEACVIIDGFNICDDCITDAEKEEIAKALNVAFNGKGVN